MPVYVVYSPGIVLMATTLTVELAGLDESESNFLPLKRCFITHTDVHTATESTITAMAPIKMISSVR